MSNMNTAKSKTQMPAASATSIVINSCNSSSEIDMAAQRKHYWIETKNGATMPTSTMTIESDTNELRKGNSQSKLSFIEQRIECLYGPEALAQGIYTPKKLLKAANTQYENIDNNDSLVKTTIRTSSSLNLLSTKESNQCKKNSNIDSIRSLTDCSNVNDLVIHDLKDEHNDRQNNDDNDDVHDGDNDDVDGDGDNDDDNDDDTVDLPCLRHLSQEFRAQLPSISPKLQCMMRNGNDQKQQQQQQQRSSQMQQMQIQQLQGPQNLSKKMLLKGGSGSGISIDDTGIYDEAISMENSSTNFSLDEVHHKTSLPIVSLDNNPYHNDELKVLMPMPSSSKQSDESVADPTKSDHQSGSTILSAASTTIKKDANYFLEQLKMEQQHLLKLADNGDMYLKMLTEISKTNEDTLGLLRSVSGKARLLVSQKMKQFESLCYDNLNSSANDKFPITIGDLQGFWDMISIQIEQINSIFRDIEDLKANGWRKSTKHLTRYSKNIGNSGNGSHSNFKQSYTK